MREVTIRLNPEGSRTTTVKVGNGATVRKISPKNASRIQDFVDKNQIEVAVVGSRVDPEKAVIPGMSDWDYLINRCEGILPRKTLREIEAAARRYLPGGNSRTDDYGNARSGMDTERGIPVQFDKPYVIFRPM